MCFFAMGDFGNGSQTQYDVARALRASSPRYTLVAVTGWGDEGARRKAQEAGFDRHMVKPVSEPALIGMLSDVGASRSSLQ